MPIAQFRVDPRLTSLLGENYRSIEQALRELVDNAWDADAHSVRISLPEPLTDQPIVIEDDGCGMSDEQLRSEYLTIARDRRSRRGERTATLNRPVRGRKGIGKFAGLVIATDMTVETRRDGKCCRLHISKHALLETRSDLERVNLPLEVTDCAPGDSGTIIRLCSLNSRFSVPQPMALKERLSLEYGRLEDFNIYVNGDLLSFTDLQGESHEALMELPTAGPVSLRFTLLSELKSAKRPGVVTRVGGKTVGIPTLFGLENEDDIPKKLWSRVVGEIQAEGLDDADVTADWGALFEDSVGVQEIQEWAKAELKKSLEASLASDLALTKSRRQKKIDTALSRLPENRRAFASRHLERALKRFYGESEEKIDVLVSLILDAFEKDEYWQVFKRIDEARHSDVADFAEALQEFGFVDMAYMMKQARRRLAFLDELDALINQPETLEWAMHTALEINLWVFGPEYSLMSSNQTLKQTIENYTNSKYRGERAKKRPDLFLAQNVLSKYLLIEFKRPSHILSRADESQAAAYRDDLSAKFGDMDILLVGCKKSEKIQSQFSNTNTKLLGYESVISTARTQLLWLLRELGD